MQQRKNKLGNLFKCLFRGFCFHNQSLFFVCCLIIFSQSSKTLFSAEIHKNIDSLYFELQKEQNPVEKLSVLKNVCAYWKHNNYDSALVYCNHVKEFAETIGMTDDYLEYNLVMGDIHQHIGNSLVAIKYFMHALEGYEEIENDEKIALSYNHIGVLYHKDGEFEKAKENFQKALEIAEEVGLPLPIANYSNNLATLYRRFNDYDNALYYHNKALKLYQSIDNKYGVANVLNNIAIIFYNKGDYKRAIDLIKQSVDIRREIGDNPELGNALFNIGFIYYQNNNAEEALRYFLESLEIAKELGSLLLQRVNYEMLAKVHENKSDYKKALDWYQKYVRINDSINTNNKQNSLVEIKTEYESKQKAQEVELLIKNAELSDIALQKTRFVFYSTLAVIALFIGFLVFLLFNIKKIALVNKLLNANNIVILRHREELLRKKEALTFLSINLKNRKREVIKQSKILNSKSNELSEKLKEIGFKKNNIDSSLRYAAKLQRTLKNNCVLKNTVVKNFAAYPFKDDLSLKNSAYWIHETDNSVFIAVFDAPHKNISGAFWCVMVNTLLNKVITEQSLTDPYEIYREVFAIMKNTFISSEGDDCDSFDDCGFLILKVNYLNMYSEYYSMHLPVILFNKHKGIFKRIDFSEIADYKNENKTKKFKIFPEDRIWLFNKYAINSEIFKNGSLNQNYDKILSANAESIKVIIEEIVQNINITVDEKKQLLIIGVQLI